MKILEMIMKEPIRHKDCARTWTEPRSNVIQSRDLPSSAVDETRSKGKCQITCGGCGTAAAGEVASPRRRYIPAKRWSISSESIPRQRQAKVSCGTASSTSTVPWVMTSNQLSNSLPVGAANVCISTPHFLPKINREWNFRTRFEASFYIRFAPALLTTTPLCS